MQEIRLAVGQNDHLLQTTQPADHVRPHAPAASHYQPVLPRKLQVKLAFLFICLDFNFRWRYKQVSQGGQVVHTFHQWFFHYRDDVVIQERDMLPPRPVGGTFHLDLQRAIRGLVFLAQSSFPLPILAQSLYYLYF